MTRLLNHHHIIREPPVYKWLASCPMPGDWPVKQSLLLNVLRSKRRGKKKMKPHLQCAEQQVSRSNLTKYCACHAERLAYLIIITYETSFTMRGATGVTIQPHQILRLSRRKPRILSPHPPHHIWNLIYNARSNRCHDPTSPKTAPVTQKGSHT